MPRHRRPHWLLWCLLATAPVTGFHTGCLWSAQPALLSRIAPEASVRRRRGAAATTGAARLGQDAAPLAPVTAAPARVWPTSKWGSPVAWIRRFLSSGRRRVLLASLGLWIGLALTQAAWAVTGGRVGGSFGASRSESSRAPPPTTSTRLYYRPSSPSYHGYSYGPSPTWLRFSARGPAVGAPAVSWDGGAGTAVATRLSTADVMLLGGTSALLAYGFYNHHHRHRGGPEGSPLGPGATVASLAVALGVPDHRDPTSILQRLRSISESATTGTRRGVQNLVAEVCLELARQERAVVSAATEWRHFGSVPLAEREFQSVSVRNRSKFDRENVNKFGSDDRSDQRRPDDSRSPGGPQATSAIVSINLAIEGDSTKLPRIRDRKDLAEALAKLASDVQVEDCLLSAEILWAPNDPGEVLFAEDIYADYPNLIPL